MANLKKSFNFRHGVQVDDDNFIVDTLGKVGIGSTVPSEYLDVGGNIRIRGTVFADEVNTDSLVNTGEDGTASFSLINVGVSSFTAGIITSSDPNGIVTYYGDARYLQGMPTSQWIDTDVGLGYTSIYAAGNVGISTTDPRFSLQIGDTNSSGSLISGVGINSVGNIDLTGTLKVGTDITASSGVITATKFIGIGSELTELDADNIAYGTIPTERIGNINISGIITATSLHGAFVGIATTARDLTDDARITIDHIESNTSDLGVTTTTTLQASTLYAVTSVGIGTSTVSADLHLRKDGVVEAQITSNDDRARLVIGRDTTAFGNNFIIDTDNDDVGAYPEESGLNSVDIYNYAPGNLNFFIRPNTAIHKKFNWINHSTSDTMMSLTQDGRLGIGKTNPDHDLHVVGTSTISSHTNIGGDFEVKGSTTLKGSLSGTSVSLSGIFRTSSKLGIGLTVDDVDPSYDFQVGYSDERVGVNTGAYITERGEGGFTGIVTAKKFSGIGSDLTDINPENISNGTIGVSGFHINSTSGIITALKFSGSGSNLTDIPASEVTGDIGGSVNINTSGIITASEFSGNGSLVTNIDPANISNGTIGVSGFHINSTSGIITASKFKGDFDGTGSSLTNIPLSAISDGGTFEHLINISNAGVITASNFVGSGSSLTEIKPENIRSGLFSNGIRTKGRVAIGVTNSSASGDISFSVSKEDVEDTEIRDTVATIEVQHSDATFPITGVSTNIHGSTMTSDYQDTVRHTSIDYHIVAVNDSSNYQASKVLIVHNGYYNSNNPTVGIETYSNLIIGNEIAKYSFELSTVDTNKLYLKATPEGGITGITTFKVYATRLG